MFVTYKCWTKINKPESRFIVQIYLFIYSVCKNTDEVTEDM